MRWLSRLLRRTEVGAPAVVSIPPDVAASLTAGGQPLDIAVEVALRAHLEAAGATPAVAAPDHAVAATSHMVAVPDHVASDEARRPFWLERDSEHTGDMEDVLRQRIVERGSDSNSG